MEESADGRGRDLVFRSLQVDDEGEYSCEAIIDGMNEKKIFYLKVIGKNNHNRNLSFIISIQCFFIIYSPLEYRNFSRGPSKVDA